MEKAQSRRSAGVNAPVASVPADLEPCDHFLAGLCAPSPLDGDPEVPRDIAFCVHTALTVPDLDRWRAEQFATLESLCLQVSPLSAELETLREEPSRLCSSHVDPGRTLLLSHSVAWPDRLLTDLVLTGCRPMGDQVPIGIFRQKETSASISCTQLLELSSQFRAALSSKSAPPPEMADAIWTKSREEREKGWISDWLTVEELDGMFGAGLWTGVFRFAVCQNGKWRLIDDASKGQNQTFACGEQIHTTSATAAAAITRYMRKTHGRTLEGPKRVCAASRDMKSAYKQLSLHSSQTRLSVLAIWDTESKCWRLALPWALPFGLGGAVLHFNRVPSFICAVARRWLGIVVTHFFDDFRLMEFGSSTGSAEKWFDRLTQLLGWRFDLEKDQNSAPCIRMLGNVESWSYTSKEQFVVMALEERLASVTAEVQGLLLAKSVSSGSAASLRGKLLHLSATREARTGRGTYPLLGSIADGNTVGWCTQLDIELRFILFGLSEPHCRTFPLTPTLDLGPRIWSDSSFEPGSPCPVMKLCTIVANHSSKAGIVCLAPPWLFPLLCERKTQIAVGELFAAFFAFLWFPSVLAESSVVGYVDNMGVIHTVVNGASTAVDLGSISMALHRRTVHLKCRVWWEYVASASNISDGGSRIGVACEVSRAAGISLREVAFPSLPPLFPLVHPRLWDFWWRAQ